MGKNDLYEAVGEVLFEEVTSDEETFDNKGYRLEQIYEKASEADKKLINDVLIAVCGWSYETLLAKAKQKVDRKWN